MTPVDTPDVVRERVRILIVDDEPANTEFLRHVLEPEGYGRLVECTDATAALDQFHDIDPDLVLLDLMMPKCDGYQFLKELRTRLSPGDFLPVLVVTGDTSAEAQRRALSLGARDFLTKPLSPADVRLRVRNLLQTRFLQARLREYNSLLEDRVVERTQELEAARLETLDRLARAAEYRDDDTGQHTQRVGRVAARLATVLGEPEEQVRLIRRAAPLHDIGKIGVPDSILLKPGRLTKEERATMQRHTRIGAEILSGSRFPLLQLAEEITLIHHEWWDGGGYPEGLMGEAIPLAGRIVAVADVFDSLTHERPYKDAWSVKEALNELQACSGSQFDPRVVEAMLRIAPEISALDESVQATMSRIGNGNGNGNASGNGSGNGNGRGNGRGRVIRPDPMESRLRTLEAEREELKRKVRNLTRQVARRDARIEKLSEKVPS